MKSNYVLRLGYLSAALLGIFLLACAQTLPSPERSPQKKAAPPQDDVNTLRSRIVRAAGNDMPFVIVIDSDKWKSSAISTAKLLTAKVKSETKKLVIDDLLKTSTPMETLVHLINLSSQNSAKPLPLSSQNPHKISGPIAIAIGGTPSVGFNDVFSLLESPDKIGLQAIFHRIILPTGNPSMLADTLSNAFQSSNWHSLTDSPKLAQVHSALLHKKKTMLALLIPEEDYLRVELSHFNPAHLDHTDNGQTIFPSGLLQRMLEGSQTSPPPLLTPAHTFVSSSDAFLCLWIKGWHLEQFHTFLAITQFIETLSLMSYSPSPVHPYDMLKNGVVAIANGLLFMSQITTANEFDDVAMGIDTVQGNRMTLVGSLTPNGSQIVSLATGKMATQGSPTSWWGMLLNPNRSTNTLESPPPKTEQAQSAQAILNSCGGICQLYHAVRKPFSTQQYSPTFFSNWGISTYIPLLSNSETNVRHIGRALTIQTRPKSSSIGYLYENIPAIESWPTPKTSSHFDHPVLYKTANVLIHTLAQIDTTTPRLRAVRFHQGFEKIQPLLQAAKNDPVAKSDAIIIEKALTQCVLRSIDIYQTDTEKSAFLDEACLRNLPGACDLQSRFLDKQKNNLSHK